MDFLYFLIIGLAAGWLAGQLVKGGGFGIVGDLVVGVIGAIVGGFLFNLLGFPPSNMLAKLIAATVGAILLILGLRMLKQKKIL